LAYSTLIARSPVVVETGVGMLVARAVFVAVGLGVLVAVGLSVLVAVGMTVLVAVGLGVLVAVGLSVLVVVGMTVLVTVGLGVLVLVRVAVAAGAGVFVGAGAAPHRLVNAYQWLAVARDPGATQIFGMPPFWAAVIAFLRSVTETVVPEGPHSPMDKIVRPVPIWARWWAIVLE